MYLSRDEELSNMTSIINDINSTVEMVNKSLKIPYINEYNPNLGNKTLAFIKYIEQQLLETLDSINELKEPFLLFIVGPGNYGKSTLINALLEDNIIETTHLPNTWKLDLFIKYKNEKIEITYKDRSKINKTLDGGINVLKKEEEKFKASKKKISRIIKEYKNINSTEVKDLKIYKSILEDKYLYKSNIVGVKYFLNRKGILDYFIIVDTPGLNQTLLKDTQIRMKDYYRRADGVIWLIDAQNIVSKENNKIIQDIVQIDSLHKDNKKNMIAVVNKMDIILKNNFENNLKVKGRVREIYQDKFSDIIFISAKEAINGIILKDEELINKSNIKELHESVDKNFREVSTQKQIKSKYKNLSLMKNNIINEMNNYKRQLYKDISKYNELEFELKDKSKEVKEYILEHLNNLKRKNYTTDTNLKALKNDVKEIESICNRNLEKLYKHLYKRSNFNQDKYIQDINIKMYLTKSKYLIMDYELKKAMDKGNEEKIAYRGNILNSLSLRNSKQQPNDEFFIKSVIMKRISSLIEEAKESLDEKLYLIKNSISQIREDSFEDMYLDYSSVEKHIDYLNDIDKILRNLG